MTDTVAAARAHGEGEQVAQHHGSHSVISRKQMVLHCFPFLQSQVCLAHGARETKASRAVPTRGRPSGGGVAAPGGAIGGFGGGLQDPAALQPNNKQLPAARPALTVDILRQARLSPGPRHAASISKDLRAQSTRSATAKALQGLSQGDGFECCEVRTEGLLK